MNEQRQELQALFNGDPVFVIMNNHIRKVTPKPFLAGDLCFLMMVLGVKIQDENPCIFCLCLKSKWHILYTWHVVGHGETFRLLFRLFNVLYRPHYSSFISPCSAVLLQYHHASPLEVRRANSGADEEAFYEPCSLPCPVSRSQRIVMNVDQRLPKLHDVLTQGMALRVPFLPPLEHTYRNSLLNICPRSILNDQAEHGHVRMTERHTKPLQEVVIQSGCKAALAQLNGNFKATGTQYM